MEVGNNNCFVCGRLDTKYSCIDCLRKICNVCSTPCLPSVSGYSEEKYMIAKCNDCIEQNNNDDGEDSGEVVITKSAKKKQKQSTLLSTYFKPAAGGNSSAKDISGDASSSSEGKAVVPSTKPAKNDSKKNNSTGTRVLTKATAENWKSTFLVSYDGSEWLVVNSDKNGNVTSLNCKICKKYASKIESMKNFGDTWAYEGSPNPRLSSAKKHASGDPHIEAMRLHNKDIGKGADEVAAKLRKDGTQSTIPVSVGKMQQDDFERTMKKFDVAYYVAKEELPLVKYESLIKLETKHGVDLGGTYLTEKSCASFIESIADTMGGNLKDTLDEVNFFSVLTDGTTDTSVIENEAVLVRYVDPNPLEGQKVNIRTSFVNAAKLKSAKASGLVDAIKTSFESIGLSDEDLKKKFVAFGADGTNSNSGVKGGAIAELRLTYGEWILFVWCVSHRLELGIKDALKGTVFEDIDDLLETVYLLYRRAPKKLRELTEIHDSFKEAEFEHGSLKPKRSGGTRWVAHKLRAMIVLLDKYGIFIEHLEQMSVDKTYKSKERATFVGYLRKWKHARYPVLLCLFIELLSPVKVLSLAFQNEDVDIVNVLASIEKTKKQLEKLISCDFEEYPTFLRFKSKLNVKDGNVYYQNAILNNIYDAERNTSTKKNQLTGLIRDFVMKRLEESQLDLLKSASVLLNTEGWRKDENFGNSEVKSIFEHFNVPLQQSGYKGSIEDIVEEWNALVHYAVTYLNVGTIPYLQLWYKIFHSSRKDQWAGILLIAELLLCLPISNAVVERLFSLLKRIKTKDRCSLGNVRITQLIRLCLDGPPVQDFDSTVYATEWLQKKIRRPNQKKRKKYAKRESGAKKARVLIDMPSSASESSSHEESSDERSHEESSDEQDS